MSIGKVPVTNFDVIEVEKENIVPLRSGRSAAALSKSLKVKSDAGTSTKVTEIRLEFEKRILNELEELDDPLELYLDYINWINNAYPQGGQSKQSGMLETLERCLMYFKDFDIYKNDPRYLKMWLWYLELFAGSESEKQSLFVYMMRKQIGSKLSLFYEEVAAFLEKRQDYSQAKDVLARGIESSARPLGRLRKTLQKFEERMRDMSMDVPSVPHGRSVLDGELPSIVLGRARGQIEEASLKSDPSHSAFVKHEIFKDVTDAGQVSDLKREGWDHLDGKAQRNKENEASKQLLAPGVNLGTLRQDTSTKASVNRLPVFKDSIGRSGPIYKILEIPGRKPEKIDCNFDLVYPTQDQEYCFEELLAMSRGIYHKKSRTKRALELETLDAPDSYSGEGSSKQQKVALKEISPPSGSYKSSAQESKNPIPNDHLQEFKAIERTSILPLNDEPTLHYGPQKKSAPSSPTVTFFSKDAIEEVYSMFNQNFSEPNRHLDNDDTTSKFAAFENFTQEFTRKTIDDLTEVKQKTQIERVNKTPQKNENVQQDVEASAEISKETTTPSYKSKLQEYMTPIQERSESSFKLASNSNEECDNEITKNNTITNTAESSPFLTQPQGLQLSLEREPLIINNPLSSETRSAQISSMEPPLSAYPNFYHYNQSLKMSALLKKIHTASKNANKNPIVDFKKTNELYCIRSQLGQGGFATVYLAESSTGSLKALKVEKPASIWEFYILKQVEKRLEGQQILASIINVDSLHCFEDESYLVLNYASQGTMLDLINLEKERNGGALDESLCMYFAVELMKVLEYIHNVGIIHGDLKPDNCMVRFEENSEALSDYDSNGRGGWDRKGVYLIDFGRSFDLTLFPSGTRFKANWKTDQQDCPEMREGRTWTYEADYYGLAGIIHAMLFGKFIETRLLPNQTYALTNSFKRYWRQELWAPLFNDLINSGSSSELPITSTIREHRLALEASLEESGGRLRSQVLSLESDLQRLRK
ncbi:LAQU0S17e00782g1_1 [Lachancea quebecensis]|uniref:LAQU0S17e00782g1_1 n=1 Tax=Lachancea quebecensis TaxID=1654605 RepID=A0A0P1KWF4_9SACH|nr:LAQU0S17e00782g1_1 [Lachancea quebecensis]